MISRSLEIIFYDLDLGLGFVSFNLGRDLGLASFNLGLDLDLEAMILLILWRRSLN